MAELKLEERETHLNMAGDNHSEWTVFTDDPYWQRRLDKFATAVAIVGAGKQYVLDSSQVSIRAKRKALSEEEKQRRADHLRRSKLKNVVNYRRSLSAAASLVRLDVRVG